ncbi:MAG: hypothetical protein LBV49_10825 [Azonexus sp.]|jgi:hypothetical protein|nr:hypothetical protein [Azonexus sp.]
MAIQSTGGGQRDAPPPIFLYRIEEFPELFADACLRNSEGQLKFLSFYGRDGVVMQFLAALELGVKEGGVTRFHLKGEDGEHHLVEAGSAGQLSKFSGRLPRQNVFGPLSQTWIYDAAFEQADRANRIGWVLHRTLAGQDQEQVQQLLLERAWAMTCQLSPVALLDDWRASLQDWCLEKDAYKRLDEPNYPPLGGIEAMRISITDHFLRYVSQGVRDGLLTV